MKPREPLQAIIDPFIKSCGGDLVADLLDKDPELPQNADYVFRRSGVIAELKALEIGSFGEAFRRKMGNLAGTWHRRRLLMVFGTQRIDLDKLPPVCQQEALDLIGKQLQDNILAKANRQIRSTKELLKLPDAKGILMVASDGNEDLPPWDVMFFFTRLLRKRHPDGSPQFSSIHSLVYFNPRMPVLMPGTGQPTLIWGTVPRQADDQEMLSFLNTLGDGFQRYMEKTMEMTFPQVDLAVDQHRDLKFPGVAPRMPRISVNYSPGNERH